MAGSSRGTTSSFEASNDSTGGGLLYGASKALPSDSTDKPGSPDTSVAVVAIDWVCGCNDHLSEECTPLKSQRSELVPPCVYVVLCRVVRACGH